jgi:hypothetical protein
VLAATEIHQEKLGKSSSKDWEIRKRGLQAQNYNK